MRVASVMLSLLLPVVASAAPALGVSGDCPGVVSFTINAVTPGANVVLIAAAGAGSAAIPGGPCAGIDSGLAAPMRWFGPFADSDRDGSVAFEPRVPDGACEMSFVALDVSSCEVSPVRSGRLG